jgi:hypothetical protein
MEVFIHTTHNQIVVRPYKVRQTLTWDPI